MIKEKMKQLVGKSIKAYNNEYSKPKIDELKFKEQYQGRIIDCMVGEVDDNYIETPETDNHIAKLEHSKEGIVKIPSIKGKTILVDSEGNETDTPGEGCRLISVGESEDNRLLISSKNKNIFDGEIESYYINSSTGQNNGWMEFWRSKDYIRCTPNDKHLVHFKYKDVKKNGAMFFYDKDKKYIGMSSTNPTVTPSNCEFIRIAGQAESSGTLIDITKVTDIMLCKGVDVADYIEPKQHKTEILLNEPLRSLPNGVCDEIVANRLKRKIIKIVLDGSEDWKDADNDLEKTYRASFNASSLGIKYTSLSTFFEPLISGISSKDTENIQHSSLYIYVRINRDRLSEQSPQGLKEWLSKNNVTVLCELEEPIIEELPNGITLQGFDDTTMYIENEITPTVQYGYNALIPYKQELLNQQEEVEVNTLDIENNIIPYLMDMEFNLMLMEDE